MTFEAKLLKDKNRLNEIFLLRCLAWDSSPSSYAINFKKFPEGYKDNLEDNSLHYIVENQENEIIAAARISIINEFEDLPYYKMFSLFNEWPPHRPFAFYSRLVIHPENRKIGLKEKLDQIRIKYLKKTKIAFSVATASERRAEDLRIYGFKAVAEFKDKPEEDFPFKERKILMLELKAILI